MVRITGSVKDENSLSSPTGELLSSVVWRSNGKREKRINGTESRALTSTEPSPSNTPRKERLLSGDNSDGLVLGSVVFSKSGSNMQLLNYRDQAAGKYGTLVGRRRSRKTCYFFFARSRI